MRIFLAIIYCFLNLAGCTDAQNRSIAATAQENGRLTLDSLTDVRMGRAWFECKASQSGRCYYAVFKEGAEVRRFDLGAGEVVRLADLPAGFSLCVASTAAGAKPGCRAA
jgi:hypothetical protein